MKTTETLISQQRWQAVQDRDTAADGSFVFAVITTGIYCRPSCRSRRARRENVLFFATPAAAETAGFRPCKRCQPAAIHPDQQRAGRVLTACRIMAASDTPLTLDAIAREVAMSPWHFHRLFKSVTGLTPKAWQQALRARRVRDALHGGETVTRAALDAGFQTGSSFYHQADAALGMTPRQYRRGGREMAVCYSVAPCELGRCLVARSERGICAILLGDDDDAVVAELARLFPHAQRLTDDKTFDEQVARVVACIHTPHAACDLPLDIRGTAFQQRVWQALRAVPAGNTLSYRELAQRIGQPDAVRAVANACAANRLAVIVPCHRVVRSSGVLAGYRWGSDRKASLLARESLIKET
ncbi:bifunctional DNA-binding transcriptional regulator/O6-methylguanine-DNA methyltransferase Ada [Siccibacter turicensis]